MIEKPVKSVVELVEYDNEPFWHFEFVRKEKKFLKILTFERVSFFSLGIWNEYTLRKETLKGKRH